MRVVAAVRIRRLLPVLANSSSTVTRPVKTLFLALGPGGMSHYYTVASRLYCKELARSACSAGEEAPISCAILLCRNQQHAELRALCSHNVSLLALHIQEHAASIKTCVDAQPARLHAQGAQQASAGQSGGWRGSRHARVYNLQALRLQQLAPACEIQEVVEVDGRQNSLARGCGRVYAGCLEQAAVGHAEQATPATARRRATRAARQAFRHMLDVVPPRHRQAGHLLRAWLLAPDRTPALLALCYILVGCASNSGGQGVCFAMTDIA